jgi:hypothetical protein
MCRRARNPEANDMQGVQVSETLLAEEFDRAIQSAVARVERQRSHLTHLYPAPSQLAEVRSRLAGMMRGLELLRARRARLLWAIDMRFHKAKRISSAEAKLIRESSSLSFNPNVVMSHNDHDWYDIRGMTENELEAFVSDLLRAERALLLSGLINPH